MLKTQNKRLLNLLPFILTICSLSYIVRTFEINSLFISFNSYFSILFLLLLGFLSVSLQNFIIAKRWLLISKFFGGKSSLKNLFYAISYSCFLNQFLPASIAGMPIDHIFKNHLVQVYIEGLVLFLWIG